MMRSFNCDIIQKGGQDENIILSLLSQSEGLSKGFSRSVQRLRTKKKIHYTTLIFGFLFGEPEIESCCSGWDVLAVIRGSRSPPWHQEKIKVTSWLAVFQQGANKCGKPRRPTALPAITQHYGPAETQPSHSAGNVKHVRRNSWGRKRRTQGVRSLHDLIMVNRRDALEVLYETGKYCDISLYSWQHETFFV